MKPLGKIQQGMIRALERNYNRWRPSDCWHWEGLKNTIRILESLERRGIVVKQSRSYVHPICKNTINEIEFKLVKSNG